MFSEANLAQLHRRSEIPSNGQHLLGLESQVMAESYGNVSNKRARTGCKFQASIFAVCDMKDEESDFLKRHFGSFIIHPQVLYLSFSASSVPVAGPDEVKGKEKLMQADKHYWLRMLQRKTPSCYLRRRRHFKQTWSSVMC
ncbi:hypothetical protein TIFTF001_017058 [Ficus carica]|uniref:Uncharacterized protein n=1 Tax=Ficus carica TaxID=3494 RepID=A0AA88DIY8_FICCA|nr:hypothetical protein TIFTF001_017058 [Ficus carica]